MGRGLTTLIELLDTDCWGLVIRELNWSLFIAWLPGKLYMCRFPKLKWESRNSSLCKAFE